MTQEPELNKVRARTLRRGSARVSVVIPAHNEESTIAEVISGARRGLDLLHTPGEIIVSASGCIDNTQYEARRAGAQVVTAPLGKGAALHAGVASTTGEIICLVDGDLEYYGDTPLVALLVDPILHGIADATISSLYWRPIYPDGWMHGFFAPLMGYLFPECLPKAGSTPWSGQRAALRKLWPHTLPVDFTADLALVLWWNEHAERMRPVLTDDWFNPIRPKPDQIKLDFELLLQAGIDQGRLQQSAREPLQAWFQYVREQIDSYRHGHDDPSVFERELLQNSMQRLRAQLPQLAAVAPSPDA